MVVEVSDPTILITVSEPEPGPDPGPAPGPAPEGSQFVQVYLDGSSVTDCVQSGSVTRKLNRPWECTLRLYSECAPGTACSTVKVWIGATLWFHGFVMQISTEAGEDGALISEYTCLDPMMLWDRRPARDGPASGDPGDFSNPLMFSDQFYTPTGPFILEQLLIQSENDADPKYGEGTLFLEHGNFPAGLVSLKGAPTDWPMTIAEVFDLMTSTGTLDAVLTPIDTGGNMARIDVFNGDYGDDLTGSVAFEYATGAHNVRSVRMVEDSSNVCNKLWYYLGPRRKRATDPAGDQHWAANIQGRDPDLPYPPGGQSFDDTNTPFGPPWDDNQLGERIYNSRVDCAVRMEVRIYDAQGDENPVADRVLYRRLWQMESWLRATPRTLVHLTPVRISEFDQLPPDVSPIQVGDFDIGDLVTVTADSIVRGGFTGAQRIYAYTVSWDEDGVVEIGELQTSADQEGFAS